MLKYQFDRVCFQRWETNANFSVINNLRLLRIQSRYNSLYMDKNCKAGTKLTDSTKNRVRRSSSCGNHTQTLFKPLLFDTKFTKILSKSFIYAPSNNPLFKTDRRLWNLNTFVIFAFGRRSYMTNWRLLVGACVDVVCKSDKSLRRMSLVADSSIYSFIVRKQRSSAVPVADKQTM